MTYKEPGRNYTKIPNPILDAISNMSEIELKLTMVLVRYTFGYHIEKAQMTYEIMQDRTGMSRGSVSRAIDLVEKRGFFIRGRKSYWYINSMNIVLNYVNDDAVNSSDSELKSMGNSSKFEPTKRKNNKDNTTTVHAILCKKFLMLTGIDPPHETTDNYTDDWQAPFDIWLQRFGDVEVVMEKMAAAVQNAIENGWRYKSPRSLMKTIANEHANGSSTNGNGRIDKHALKDALWHIVTRSKDYTEAKTQAGPDEWGFLKAMGKWRDVRSLNETTFNIRFYEVFKNANH